MKKLNFDFSLEHKGQTVSIKNNTLLFDGKELPKDIPKLLQNAVFVNKFIKQYISIIDKVPKTYIQKLSFDNAIDETRYLLQARNILLFLKGLVCDENAGSWRQKSTYDKFKEEVDHLMVHKIPSTWGTPFDKWSKPQKWVYKIVSKDFSGSTVNSWDMHELVNPITNSTEELDKLVKEFLKFNYKRYGEVDSKKMIGRIKELEKRVKDNLENFKKIKEIAGDEFAFWTSQKIIARGKKHNVNTNFPSNWTNKYQEHLKKTKKVKALVVKQKIPKSKELITKYQEYINEQSRRHWEKEEPITQSLTGEELITVFKNTARDSAYKVIRDMDSVTAVSLLGMTTKNVTDKLNRDAIREIQTRVAEGPTKAELKSDQVSPFKILLEYFKKYPDKMEISWELLFKHQDELSPQNYYFLAGSSMPFTEIPDTFFDKILSKLDKKDWYHKNSSQSHAFLKRSSPKEIERLLNAAFNNMVSIDIRKSIQVFDVIPYRVIRKMLGWKQSNYDIFTQRIVENKDTALAEKILIEQKHSNPGKEEIALYKMLSFSKRYELLESRYVTNVSELFEKEDLVKFTKKAISNKNLTSYIDNLSWLIKGIFNDLVTETKKPICPLNSTLIEALSKDNIKKLLKQDAFTDSSRYTYSSNNDSCLEKIYKKLSLKDYKELFPKTPITEHKHKLYLEHLMTPEELGVCSESEDFLRQHTRIIPLDYLKKYKDKTLFKDIVGDRRNTENNYFGSTLEARIKEL